ncbi:MAG: alpha/beta fold hydrolase [Bacteroidota bacterium]
MAIYHVSTYPGPPWYQINGHWQTIIPAFGGPKVNYQRERLELTDGDFIDLDWLHAPDTSRQLVILTHGLEGNSDRPYIRSAAHFFQQKGWDVLAWNCRSCSGEMNRALRLYHHGEIEDIHELTLHALASKPYEQIVLIGYSMGGAMTTKYMSVHGDELPEEIIGGIAFSAPYDLKASVDALEIKGNGIYKKRFLRQLGDKITIKDQRFPGLIDISKLREVRRWQDFDEWFTAPLLGLDSADAFYALASAKNFMDGLKRPILAVSALNDPIIPDSCLPFEQAKTHPYFDLELTPEGGHVGYTLAGKAYNWMDERAWEAVEAWI